MRELLRNCNNYQPQWPQVLSVLGVDAIVGVACLLGFVLVILRITNKEGDVLRSTALHYKFDESLMTDKVHRTQRLGAVLYFEFFDMLLALNLMMLVGTVVLAPLNWYSGDGCDKGFFTHVSAFNIDSHSGEIQGLGVLWAHGIFTWLLSFGTLGLVMRCRYKFLAIEEQYGTDIEEFTVQIRGLPTSLVDPEKILTAVKKEFAGVEAVNIAYELSDMLNAMRRHNNNVCDIDVCEQALETGYQPRACVCCAEVTFNTCCSGHRSHVSTVLDQPP